MGAVVCKLRQEIDPREMGKITEITACVSASQSPSRRAARGMDRFRLSLFLSNGQQARAGEEWGSGKRRSPGLMNFAPAFPRLPRHPHTRHGQPRPLRDVPLLQERPQNV